MPPGFPILTHPATRADLTRAVIRTAALSHWRHHRVSHGEAVNDTAEVGSVTRAGWGAPTFPAAGSGLSRLIDAGLGKGFDAARAAFEAGCG